MKSKLKNPSVVEIRDVPAVDKGPLPPVEFVKHWIAMFGNFKDGKIKNSRVMKYEDLTIEDVKYLLDAGISINQIAVQYSLSESALTNILSKEGVLSELTDDATWFTEQGSNSFRQPSHEPIMRFLKGNISLNSTFVNKLKSEYIHIGVTTDNKIKVKPSSYGIRLQNNGGKLSGTRRVSCAPAKNFLVKQGIKIPAAFRMAKDDSGCWIGVLIDDGK